MDGPTLETFCTELNGGASIGSTLLFQLINASKAMVEQRRPWMILRSTDTSVSVAASSTWQTALSLAGIARFNRFDGSTPIKLYDGIVGVTRFTQRPIANRLYAKDEPNTFCFEESTKTLYLNGTVPYAGTLWIDHIKDSPDLTDDESSTWVFPTWSHTLLGFMAVAMSKGGIDYDDINAHMAPDNRAQALNLITLLENWDSGKQLSAVENSDPYNNGEFPRSNSININP